VFWECGYSGATLDRLSAATGMSRPSLYGAFGNKEALFQSALTHFRSRMESALEGSLAQPRLEAALEGFYLSALEIYLGSGEGPRGCLLFTVAAVPAAENEPLREEILAAIRGLDRALAGRFRQAIGDGELDAGCDAELRAGMAAAVLHSLSVRARAGQSRRSLRAFARKCAHVLATKAG